MAYDEILASRVREILSSRNDVTEKKMFGGLCFMVRGHMCCGIDKANFMLRVGPDQYEAALARRHARPMDFTGRPLKGFIYVDAAGLTSRRDLEQWLAMGLAFIMSLPVKPEKKRKLKKKPA